MRGAFAKIDANVGAFLLLALFSLGLPRVFTQAAASSLFLKAHGPEALALVYLAVAGLIPLAINLFLRAERITTRFALLVGVEGARVVFLIALRIGLMSGADDIVSVFAVIWTELEFVLGSLVFWGLAGQCFTISQARQSFPIIGSGEQIGSIVAAGVIGILLLRFQTADLLLASVASDCVGIALIILISRRFPALQDRPPKVRPEGSRPAPPPNNRMRTYIVLMFAAGFLANISYFLIDNLFYRVTDEMFTRSESIASFIGLVFGLSGGATLLFTWFIVPKAMARFGVGVMLTWLPLALLVATAAFLFTQGLALFPATFGLAIIVAVKLIDEGLLVSVYRPAFQTLYQPLPAAQRIRSQAWIDGVAEPVGIASAAVILVAATMAGVSIYIIALIEFAGICLWAIVTFKLRRSYLGALSLAASRRQDIGDNAAALAGPDARSVLLRKLRSDDTSDVLASVNLLSIADRPLFLKAAPALIMTGERRIASAVIGALRTEDMADMFALFKNRFLHERDEGLRRRLLGAMAATGSRAAVPFLLAQLRWASPLQSTALAALADGDCGGATASAIRRLRKLSSSDDVGARRMFLDTAEQMTSQPFAAALTAMFGDRDRSTARRAMKIAGRSRLPAFVSPLVDHLADADTADTAGRSLETIGGESVNRLVEVLRGNGDPAMRARAAASLGRIGGPVATAAIKAELAGDQQQVVAAAACALWVARAHISRADLQRVWHACGLLLHHAALLVLAADDIGPCDKGGLLEPALKRQAIQLVIGAKLLAGAARRYHGAELADLLSPRLGEAERLVLAELVDMLLPPDLRALGSALTGDLEPEDRIVRLRALTDQAPRSCAEQLRDLVSAKPYQAPWIRCLALACLTSSEAWHGQSLAAAMAGEPGLFGSMARELAAPRHCRQGDKPMSLSTIEKVLLLKPLDLFHAIPDDSLATFAPLLSSTYVEPGETVFAEGEPGDCLYVVVSGELAAIRGGAVFRTVGQGEIVGEMAALEPQPRQETVKATSETHLLEVTAHHMESMIGSQADIGMAIIRVLCRRLGQRTAS